MSRVLETGNGGPLLVGERGMRLLAGLQAHESRDMIAPDMGGKHAQV